MEDPESLVAEAETTYSDISTLLRSEVGGGLSLQPLDSLGLKRNG
jgi:hypothetical protein